jgi:hypothetical protein
VRPPLLSFRIPRYIEHNGIRLRPLRIIDTPVIRKGLRGEDVLSTAGPGKPLSGGCLSVWWWLKKTYTILFCIEVESKCIGLIGLYNLNGEYAEVTLVIFDSHTRRLGYGFKAYTALTANLCRSSFIKKLVVAIKTDNYPSLSFWKKLGFEEVGAMSGIRTMGKGLEGNSA